MLGKMQTKETTRYQTTELHELLVQTVIDYLNENNLNDVEEVHFSADGLQNSREFRKWTPMTDSSLQLIGIENGVRKEIDYSM